MISKGQCSDFCWLFSISKYKKKLFESKQYFVYFIKKLREKATALPRHQYEEETDKIKQAQIEQTYEKHYD